MHIDLDELITTPAPADLSGCTLGELRSIRDQHQDVENGLSYARRIVQGRLDTVGVEMERRSDGAADDLIQRLPDAFAQSIAGRSRQRAALRAGDVKDVLRAFADRHDLGGVDVNLFGEKHPADLGQQAGSVAGNDLCLLYTSPSPRDRTRSRMPSSA